MQWDVIYTYTRRQAIEDGVLIDVSNLARQAGYKWPVALTSHLYHTYINPNKNLESYGQSDIGRLWDVLNVLRHEAQNSNGTTVLFQVSFLMEIDCMEEITLKAIAGPGDEGEPVITIMTPEED